jgi:hypothetical protein
LGQYPTRIHARLTRHAERQLKAIERQGKSANSSQIYLPPILERVTLLTKLLRNDCAAGSPSSVSLEILRLVVSLFVRRALFATLTIAAAFAIGEGEARASYRVSLKQSQDFTSDLTTSCGCGAVERSDSTVDSEAKFKLPIDGYMIVDFGQAGAAGTSTTSSSPSPGVPAVLPEATSLPVPFVTLLRSTRERVAVISRPGPVFEPPRAA